jgi:hypothetical protein
LTKSNRWFKELSEVRKDFWGEIHEPLTPRHLARKDRRLIDLGLRTTRGSYKTMASLFKTQRKGTIAVSWISFAAATASSISGRTERWRSDCSGRCCDHPAPGEDPDHKTCPTMFTWAGLWEFPGGKVEPDRIAADRS